MVFHGGNLRFRVLHLYDPIIPFLCDISDCYCAAHTVEEEEEEEIYRLFTRKVKSGPGARWCKEAWISWHNNNNNNRKAVRRNPFTPNIQSAGSVFAMSLQLEWNRNNSSLTKGGKLQQNTRRVHHADLKSQAAESDLCRRPLPAQTQTERDDRLVDEIESTTVAICCNSCW